MNEKVVNKFKNKTILCISPSSWYSLWRNRQQIMSRLAENYNVLYVEPQRVPEWSTWKTIKLRYKNIFSPRLEEISPNLTLIYPSPSLPWGGSILSPAILRWTTPPIVWLNCLLLTITIRRVLQKLKITSPILYLWEPFYLNLVGNFAEQLVCYHVYDENSDFVFNRRIKNVIKNYDHQLCRKADFVFTASQKQYDRRKSLNTATYLIPNGVDFELFNRALNPELVVPDDISHIHKPIIGFVGCIADFIVDINLLFYLAKNRPQWSLLLVGPDNLENSVKKEKLHKLINVTFVGKKELNVLPLYIKKFDVALMPYILSGHTFSIYPLKLHEYLAAGKPVVSSNIPAVLPFADVVRISHSYDEFIQGIEFALVNNSQDEIEKRLKIARENTWDQRVEMIMELLENSRKIKKDKKTVETIEG